MTNNIMEYLLDLYNARVREDGGYRIVLSNGREVLVEKGVMKPNLIGWWIDGQFFTNTDNGDFAARYLRTRVTELASGKRVILHPKYQIPALCGTNPKKHGCRHPKQNTALCMDCPVHEETLAVKDGLDLIYAIPNIIEMNRENLRCCNDFDVVELGTFGSDAIACTFETWFDVEKKFDVSIPESGDRWVDLWAYYTPGNPDFLRLECNICSDSEPTEATLYEPTLEERELVIALIKEGLASEDPDMTPEKYLKEYFEDLTDSAAANLSLKGVAALKKALTDGYVPYTNQEKAQEQLLRPGATIAFETKFMPDVHTAVVKVVDLMPGKFVAVEKVDGQDLHMQIEIPTMTLYRAPEDPDIQ